MKECHYSVLQVDYKATFDEIRQAYKQLSLKWHPDKNRSNVEEATRRFQLIAAAYELLSDPKERAWYDSHRRQILSGNDGDGCCGGEGSNYDPSEINLWMYFSRDMFEEFDDGEDGFYAVYRKLFEDLVEEEMRYLSKDSSDYTFWKNANRFGDSQTSLESVMDFYRFWSNFSSTRAFSWKDIWNLNQAQNRQIRRIMETENSKERKKGRKEYNETVRRLVEYVKKRDPRVVLYMRNKSEQMLRLQKEREQQKLLQEARRRAREEARIEEMRRFEELEAERRELYGSDCSRESDQDSECCETVIYSCKLCGKTFKSEQQLNSHIKSKKHISKLNELKKRDPERYDFLMNNTKDDNEKGAADHVKGAADPLSNSTLDSEKDTLLRETEDEDGEKVEEEEDEDGEKVEEEDEEGEEEEEEEINVKKITEMMDNLSGKGPKNRAKSANVFKEPTKKESEARKSPKEEKKSKGNSDKNVTMWKCLVCNHTFESRNKLFAHVKEKNHAQVKSSSNYKNSKVKKTSS